MRFASLLVVLLALAVGGCSDVKKELDTPGPAPPPNPKGAALEPNLIQEPADSKPEPGSVQEPADDSPPDPLDKPLDESRVRDRSR